MEIWGWETAMCQPIFVSDLFRSDVLVAEEAKDGFYVTGSTQ